MMLADILHNVLLSRGQWQVRNNSHIESKNTDKRLDDAFRRLCKSVDYCAERADKVLRCRITSVALPNGNDGVCISILPSHRSKNKSRKIKKQ